MKKMNDLKEFIMAKRKELTEKMIDSRMNQTIINIMSMGFDTNSKIAEIVRLIINNNYHKPSIISSTINDQSSFKYESLSIKHDDYHAKNDKYHEFFMREKFLGLSNNSLVHLLIREGTYIFKYELSPEQMKEKIIEQVQRFVQKYEKADNNLKNGKKTYTRY